MEPKATRVIRYVEGTAATGEFLVKSLEEGDHVALLEMRLPAGVTTPLHAHAHESILYIIRGKLRTTIEGIVHDLGPGEACRHPSHTEHTVEALEETLFLEIKSPVPDWDEVLGS